MTSSHTPSSYSRPQSYAPTPYSYVPQSSLNATISVDQEVTLPSNPAERDLLESLAELYSIIVTLDDLEKAFNKGSVSGAEYTDHCWRAITQYKSILRDERVVKEYGNLESFKREWDMEVPRATERLRVMVPATIEHATGPGGSNTGPSAPTASPYPYRPSASPGNSTPYPSGGGGQGGGGPSVQQTVTATENFITFLDAVKLGMVSKDQLHPLLSDVITSANNVTEADFDGRANIIKWLIKLNQMRAMDELDEDQKREIEFDIGAAYTGFKKAISG